MSNILSAEAKNFLASHELAVLSTLSKAGQVQGVAIYYCLLDDYLYLLTKSESSKAHNMMTHSQVALTVYDSDEIKTVQLQGEAYIEADQETKRFVYEKLVRIRDYAGDKMNPPVTNLRKGGFIIFRVEPTNAAYTDYKAATI